MLKKNYVSKFLQGFLLEMNDKFICNISYKCLSGKRIIPKLYWSDLTKMVNNHTKFMVTK